MNPFELMLNGINGIWMFIIMMITFWSRCELEDLGRVGPAFLVPRLDYHLQQIHNFNTFFLEKDKILMKNVRIREEATTPQIG